MTIDFFNGEILPTPHELPPERSFNKVGTLVHAEEAYVLFGDWFPDLNGKLWVSSFANAYSPDEAEELIEEDHAIMKDGEFLDITKLCRIVCLEITDPENGDEVKGFVVDCSPHNLDTDDNIDNKLTKRSIRYHSIASAAMDDSLPVFGLLKNEEELDEFKKILASKKYQIELRDNVVEPVEEPEE